jgi:outer membrane protein assembly factor BamB
MADEKKPPPDGPEKGKSDSGTGKPDSGRGNSEENKASEKDRGKPSEKGRKPSARKDRPAADSSKAEGAYAIVPKDKNGEPYEGDPQDAEKSKKARWWDDRRKLAGAVAVGVLLLAGVAFGAYQALKRPADVSNGDNVPFKVQKPKKVVKTTNWPMFGFDRARTRWLPAGKVKPPYEKLWKYGDRPLIEFPPIFVKARPLCDHRSGLGCHGRLFFVDNNGFAYSLAADSGKILWHKRIAQLNASSPAYSKGRLFIVSMDPPQIISLDAATGRRIWRHPLDDRSESSPVVVGNRVFFGDADGTLNAVKATNGRTIWSTPLAGPVKAAPAYKDGILYVGDYGGEMSAVRASNGEIKWQASAQGAGFGRTGQFYSTPAVAFGRVYAGNNDSRVYSFDARNGDLAWTQSTGGYVYSGPAVADTKDSPPTVYIGSFDGNIYALDAKTGSVRWSHDVGGSVIGSLSVIGGVVYVATFDGTTTYGFTLGKGRKVFTYPTGAYMPVISDGRRIYLTGYSSVTALQPVKSKPPAGGGKKGAGKSSGDSTAAP